MTQFKLCKVFDNNKSEVMNNLVDIYGESNLLPLSTNIIGIAYEQSGNDYKHVLKNVVSLGMSQVIISSQVFLRLIEYCIDNDWLISEVSFLDSISLEDKEFVDEQIRLINGLGGTPLRKKQIKMSLIKELNWLTSDGCIDIKTIEFSFKGKNGFYSNIVLMNNGILLIDDTSIVQEIRNIMKAIL